MVRPVHAVLLRTCSPFACLVGERRILHSAETDNVVRAVLSLWCSFVLYGACCTYVPACLCRARELHVGALLSTAATDLLCLPGVFAIQLLCARGTATLLRDERWLRLPAHRSPWLCGPVHQTRFDSSSQAVACFAIVICALAQFVFRSARDSALQLLLLARRSCTESISTTKPAGAKRAAAATVHTVRDSCPVCDRVYCGILTLFLSLRLPPAATVLRAGRFGTSGWTTSIALVVCLF
jgi:hypothetical protein